MTAPTLRESAQAIADACRPLQDGRRDGATMGNVSAAADNLRAALAREDARDAAVRGLVEACAAVEAVAGDNGDARALDVAIDEMVEALAAARAAGLDGA